MTPALIDAVLFVIALAVCLIAPATSYYPLLLLFLSGPLERLVDRIQGRSAEQPAH